jgi:hypothetical protein
MFKDFPMKTLVPIIVITWILSLISCLAIVYTLPSAFGLGVGKGSITSDKIADGAVITAKLANGNVTSAKILDGNITAIDLADGSIIDVKIANGTITGVKLANGTITSVKLADGTITSAKLAPNVIPFAQTTSTSTAYIYSTGTTWSSIMSVGITISRPSYFWIMFSSEAWNDGGLTVYARAWVYTPVTNAGASPTQVTLCSDASAKSYACNFYYYAFAPSYPASFTVYIQSQVSGSTGHMGDRSLAVIAFPA